MNGSMKARLILEGIAYWLLQLTWGAILCYPSLLMSLALKALGYRSRVEGYGFQFESKSKNRYWGGFTFGVASVICEAQWGRDTPSHEYGHTIQNCAFGPLQLIVSACSMVACWIWDVRSLKHKKVWDYESMPWESTATKWGRAAISRIILEGGKGII
jgi:hypothetical protein